ncbi:hypothetical protein [Saccharomonospora iraqiensis]|uniref:hypothetical protein n=1 Tax=Saccharomonospora iraqiensis TaxID=52698 RepID=UPI0006871E9E|nr:hypothetical protein [Saccharomonospora iraqiensis]
MPLVPDPGQPTSDQRIDKSVTATDPEAVDKAAAETRKLLDSARDKGFRISPEGVEPLKKALANMQSRLDELLARHAAVLSQRPKLGSHPYGQTVADHDLKSGSGDTTSATTVLKALVKVIENADKALDIALRNYQEEESETARNVSGKQA